MTAKKRQKNRPSPTTTCSGGRPGPPVPSVRPNGHHERARQLRGRGGHDCLGLRGGWRWGSFLDLRSGRWRNGRRANGPGNHDRHTDRREQNDDQSPPHPAPPSRSGRTLLPGRPGPPGHGRLRRGRGRQRRAGLGPDHGGVAPGAEVAVQAGSQSPLAAASFWVSRLTRQPTVAPPFVDLDLHEVPAREAGARPGHQIADQQGLLPRHDVENSLHREWAGLGTVIASASSARRDPPAPDGGPRSRRGAACGHRPRSGCGCSSRTPAGSHSDP